MKRILIICLLILALVGLYMLNTSPDTTVDSPDLDSTTEFRPNPSNATFVFDDGPITLSQGMNEREVVPGSALTEETRLTEHIAYGDLNDDGRDDAAMLLVRQGGVSGIFIYVAGFVSGPGSYKGTNAVFIGDRVSPQSISVSEGVVTVEYLDRGSEEPLAAEPTISSTQQFTFVSGELVKR